MPRITETIDVGLPAQTVFDYLAHFENTAEWDPGIAEAERLDDGPLAVGSRFRLQADLRVTTAPLVYELTRLESPTRVTLRTEGTLVSGEDDIRIEPVDADRCRVTWDARFGLRGPVGRLLDPLFAPAFSAIGRKAVAGLDARLRELAAAR